MGSSAGQEAFKTKNILHVPGEEPRVLFVQPGYEALYCDSLDTPGKARVGAAIEQMTMGQNFPQYNSPFLSIIIKPMISIYLLSTSQTMSVLEASVTQIYNHPTTTIKQKIEGKIFYPFHRT
jgi:hypothetical protein